MIEIFGIPRSRVRPSAMTYFWNLWFYSCHMVAVSESCCQIACVCVCLLLLNSFRRKRGINFAPTRREGYHNFPVICTYEIRRVRADWPEKLLLSYYGFRVFAHNILFQFYGVELWAPPAPPFSCTERLCWIYCGRHYGSLTVSPVDA